jgi:hypothetical protein
MKSQPTDTTQRKRDRDEKRQYSEGDSHLRLIVQRTPDVEKRGAVRSEPPSLPTVQSRRQG